MRTISGIVNLLWLAAIVGFGLAGWTNGLLALIAVILLDASLNVSMLRQQLKPMTDVFAEDVALSHEADARAIDAVMGTVNTTYTFPSVMKEH